MAAPEAPSATPAPRETLLLVDGNNLVYRSFYAIPPLANRAGLPTNAVLGFANVLRKLLADENPAFAAVTFDAGGQTFRHERYQEYKANRPPTPSDLKTQMPHARRLCAVLGLPVVEFHGIEADDIIGTLATRGIEEGYSVLIASSDKDLFQLVTDDVTVIHPAQYDRLDPAAVRAKLGVAPDRVVDFLALKGDTVDNVPGVPGIGDKGAAKLIEQFGSVEEILAHADEVKNKRQREALKEHHDGALLSKELVTIDRALDFVLPLEDLRARGSDREEAFALFEELEFTTLIKDYLPSGEPEDLDMELHALESKSALTDFLDRAKRRGRLSLWLDLSESKRFDPWSQSLAGVGLAIDPGEGFSAFLTVDELIACLEPILEDASVLKVGHNLKQVIAFFGARGIAVRGVSFDSQVAAYVLNPSRRSQALPDLLLEFLQTSLTDQVAAADSQGVLPGMDEQETSAAAPLCAERAERMLRLEEKMSKRLVDEGLDELHRDIELPLVSVLASVELEGIAIDTAVFQEMSQEIDESLKTLTSEIYELAGVEFNINSPRQLGEILFDKMNLPSFKKTQKQRAASTRVEVLEELAKSFPFPRKVLDYRSLSKLKGTYVDALPALVSAHTGRLHTTFNQTVAATGRLSSSDPNLQNIPIRTALGQRLRYAFVAPEGAKLLSADYSQIELRVLAHLSKDENLIEAFHLDEDIHERTAREVFGDDSDLSEHERRRRAKIINFSIIYGKTAFTLGKDFGIPTREAQAFIDAYFDRYPKVSVLLETIVRDARRTGEVRTLFGRKRYVPEIGSRNRNTRSGAERVAVNTPIQGTAADLIKKAMLDCFARLSREALRSRLLLQVHDELVLEVRDDEVDKVSILVRETMEDVYPLEVPLKVDMKIGQSWGG